MNYQKTYDLKKTTIISFISIGIFVLGIYLISLTLGHFRETLLVDEGAAWYYWKLPEVKLWATVTAWGLYILHQVSVWYLIYQLRYQKRLSFNELGPTNLKLLLVNAFFILLHLIQSALFYDGLAQNVPVMSSQGSVIVMLVIMLILMNDRRGLFFGKRIKLPPRGVQGVFKMHSYYIAWALVYTFWFHPTEGTIGHLMGFFYMFLLMLQMSLAHTKFHTKIRWITLLEIYVAVHGALVAVEAQNGMWPMFMFGFLMMFIVTGMYGVISKKVARVGATVVYLLMTILVYSGVFGNANIITEIHQITWIPIILYALVFVLTWGVGIIFGLIKKANNREKLNGQ